METTFTNPFEIVTDDVIFGLDTIKPATGAASLRFKRDLEEFPEENRVKIPKYNNFMKKVKLRHSLVSLEDLKNGQPFAHVHFLCTLGHFYLQNETFLGFQF